MYLSFVDFYTSCGKWFSNLYKIFNTFQDVLDISAVEPAKEADDDAATKAADEAINKAANEAARQPEQTFQDISRCFKTRQF